MPKPFLAIPWKRMATLFLGVDGRGPWLCAEPGVSLRHRRGRGQGPCRHPRRQPRHRSLDQERENRTGNLASETRRAGVTKATGKALLPVSLAACEGGHGVCSEKLGLWDFFGVGCCRQSPTEARASFIPVPQLAAQQRGGGLSPAGAQLQPELCFQLGLK